MLDFIRLPISNHHIHLTGFEVPSNRIDEGIFTLAF